MNNIFEIINEINKELFNSAKKKNVDALFEIGRISLCYNRIGFARAFLNQAANMGHLAAKHYLDVLLLSNFL
jgi:hypothetical protein